MNRLEACLTININQITNNGEADAYEKLINGNHSLPSQSFELPIMKDSSPLKKNSQSRGETPSFKSWILILGQKIYLTCYSYY